MSISKKGYEVIAEVLSGPVKDKLEELEHQDVYDFIVSEFTDRFMYDEDGTFDNFDEDKFIDAT
tara:strand:+ start:282 stop:473 length:192 start_codon:yes stop_codon:yes gene_type:complete